ncbi:MAG: flavodoxin family protein [Prevotellaceae bacterium]|nr:flavodoxin family protein [Candidatus Colivivens equi]
MKVLLINGSPRKSGNTYTALAEIAKQLSKHDIKSEILWVGNKAVRGCIACGQCKSNGDKRCVFGDYDICNEVISKMGECDAIIIGAPVYWGQPASQALAIQQRMLYAGGGNFQGKPAAAVCICRRGGATAAFQTLQMPFQMCNMPLIGSQYWNIAYGREEGEVSKDIEGLQTMRTLANNMAWMLKKIHDVNTTDTPERETWTPMHFIR